MEIDATNLLPDLSDIVAFSVKRSAPDPSDPYSGFNICHYTGDRPDHVSACRQALADRLQVDLDRLIIPRQTHSCTVATIDRIPYPADLLEGVDALVTALPGVALCINTADCVPLILVDPQAHVIAAAHCGWRGTVALIARKTIDTMITLGADPARIHAAMGPSICPRCFEVGPEVAAQFLTTFGPAPILPLSALYSKLSTPNSPLSSLNPKPHIDLPAAITQTLTQAGIPAANIAPPPACSHCSPQTYNSARRQSINSARTPTLLLQKS